jgi:hypothetical protein
VPVQVRISGRDKTVNKPNNKSNLHICCTLFVHQRLNKGELSEQLRACNEHVRRSFTQFGVVHVRGINIRLSTMGLVALFT